MTGRMIRRYCRAVGSYLPCSRKQKRQILENLRQRLKECCDEHPGEATPEEQFGTPQQVAAGYVDDMDTMELLQALRFRRRVLTILTAGILAVLAIFVIALCVQLYDFHQSMNGWSVITIIED